MKIQKSTGGYYALKDAPFLVLNFVRTSLPANQKMCLEGNWFVHDKSIQPLLKFCKSKGVQVELERDEEDPYKVLFLLPTAPLDVVKCVYRELMKKHHPDRNQGDPKSVELTRKINEAYEKIVGKGK